MFIIATLITFRIISIYQREKIQFFYNRSSSLMKEFLQTTNVRKLTYTPHFMALHGNMQSFLYMFTEMAVKLVYPYKYERELFKL